MPSCQNRLSASVWKQRLGNTGVGTQSWCTCCSVKTSCSENTKNQKGVLDNRRSGFACMSFFNRLTAGAWNYMPSWSIALPNHTGRKTWAKMTKKKSSFNLKSNRKKQSQPWKRLVRLTFHKTGKQKSFHIQKLLREVGTFISIFISAQAPMCTCFNNNSAEVRRSFMTCSKSLLGKNMEGLSV